MLRCAQAQLEDRAAFHMVTRRVLAALLVLVWPCTAPSMTAVCDSALIFFRKRRFLRLVRPCSGLCTSWAFQARLQSRFTVWNRTTWHIKCYSSGTTSAVVSTRLCLSWYWWTSGGCTALPGSGLSGLLFRCGISHSCEELFALGCQPIIHKLELGPFPACDGALDRTHTQGLRW